jgi:hypothetical protein
MLLHRDDLAGAVIERALPVTDMVVVEEEEEVDVLREVVLCGRCRAHLGRVDDDGAHLLLSGLSTSPYEELDALSKVTASVLFTSLLWDLCKTRARFSTIVLALEDDTPLLLVLCLNWEVSVFEGGRWKQALKLGFAEVDGQQQQVSKEWARDGQVQIVRMPMQDAREIRDAMARVKTADSIRALHGAELTISHITLEMG